MKATSANLLQRLFALIAAVLLLAAPSHAAAETAAANRSTAMQELVKSFDSQRQALLAQRQAILGRLRAAKTAAERQQILNEAKQNEQAMLASQHDLAKQVRDEIKQLRESHRGPPGG